MPLTVLGPRYPGMNKIGKVAVLMELAFSCKSWNSSTLATSCEEVTHWKRLWCWEGLGAGGEGDDRGWDGWMASLTQWTWVWVNSGRWWWTGRSGMLRFTGSQRVRHDWATELNWTEGLMLLTISSNVYLPFVNTLLRNVYLGLLPILIGFYIFIVEL